MNFKKILFAVFFVSILFTSVSQAATGLVKYTYDDFYRLTKVENSDGSSINFTYDLLGSRKTMVIVGPAVAACLPPVTGDWIVTVSCTYTGNVTAPANVIVQNNAVLTIENGAMLNIDMLNYSLKVKSGSGVLVKFGGKIY